MTMADKGASLREWLISAEGPPEGAWRRSLDRVRQEAVDPPPDTDVATDEHPSEPAGEEDGPVGGVAAAGSGAEDEEDPLARGHLDGTQSAEGTEDMEGDAGPW